MELSRQDVSCLLKRLVDTHGNQSNLAAAWCIFSEANFVSIQDAMDLISGRYSINQNSPSPFHLNSFESLSVSISLLKISLENFPVGIYDCLISHGLSS